MKKLGGAAVRSALLAGQVAGFHSPREADSALLSTDREFNLSSLPRGVPGEVLLSNGCHPDVTRGRLHHATDDAVGQVLERFGGDQGDLHDDELAALGAEFGVAWGQLRAANREQRPDRRRRRTRARGAVGAPAAVAGGVAAGGVGRPGRVPEAGAGPRRRDRGGEVGADRAGSA